MIGDDIMPLCTLINPTLTTIEQALDYFGEQALSILINQVLNGSRSPVRICTEPKLIIRDSTTAFSS